MDSLIITDCHWGQHAFWFAFSIGWVCMGIWSLVLSYLGMLMDRST